MQDRNGRAWRGLMKGAYPGADGYRGHGECAREGSGNAAEERCRFHGMGWDGLRGREILISGEGKS